MKTDALAPLAAQLARASPSLSFPDEGDFASRLTLGQIIKGRVLLSYDTQRHLVDFGGQRRVVDSAVPLRPDEVFHGRVVGLGERVQVQKLASEPTAPRAPEADTRAPAGDEAEPLAALFARYRVDLPPARIQAAAPTVSRLQPSAPAALGALVLAKLGLPLEPSLIRALHARLAGQQPPDAAATALRLEIGAPSAGPRSDGATAPLAQTLAGLLAGTGPSAGGTDGDGEPDPRRPRDAAQHLLNVQTGGRIAHRLGVLPLLVDGRLLTFEVALFDEPPPEAEAAVPRHRQIVIALDTEALGRVEVHARLAGSRMALTLSTSGSEGTLALSLHGAALRAAIESLGFEVDDLRYATHAAPLPGAPLQRTVEHIVNPGSVSRWA